MRIASSTAGNMVQSAVFPVLSTIDRGSPRPSTAMWTLVVSPPRDRPSASRRATAAGSSDSSPPSAPFCGRPQHADAPGRLWSRSRPSTPRRPPRRYGPGPPATAWPRCRLSPTGRSADRRSAMGRIAQEGRARAHQYGAATAPRSRPADGLATDVQHRRSAEAAALSATTPSPLSLLAPPQDQL